MNQCKKLSMYADDMTVAVSDLKSAKQTFEVFAINSIVKNEHGGN